MPTTPRETRWPCSCSRCARAVSRDGGSSPWRRSTSIPPAFYGTALLQYYADAEPPPEVYVGRDCPRTTELLERWLTERRGRQGPSASFPSRGPKKTASGDRAPERLAGLRCAIPGPRSPTAWRPWRLWVMRWNSTRRPTASSASTSRTSRARTRSPRWWSGKGASRRSRAIGVSPSERLKDPTTRRRSPRR